MPSVPTFTLPTSLKGSKHNLPSRHPGHVYEQTGSHLSQVYPRFHLTHRPEFNLIMHQPSRFTFQGTGAHRHLHKSVDPSYAHLKAESRRGSRLLFRTRRISRMSCNYSICVNSRSNRGIQTRVPFHETNQNEISFTSDKRNESTCRLHRRQQKLP